MAKAKYSLALSLLALLVPACSSSSPTAPSSLTQPALAVRDITYDINIPNVGEMLTLKATYPNGVRMSPVAAQARWDYTRAYGGSPNVYYGEVAPHCEYVRAGIVVAPYRVASMDTFAAADWPGVMEPGFTYSWVGRFTFTAIPTPDEFTMAPGKCPFAVQP